MTTRSIKFSVYWLNSVSTNKLAYYIDGDAHIYAFLHIYYIVYYINFQGKTGKSMRLDASVINFIILVFAFHF